MYSIYLCICIQGTYIADKKKKAEEYEVYENPSFI